MPDENKTDVEADLRALGEQADAGAEPEIDPTPDVEADPSPAAVEAKPSPEAKAKDVAPVEAGKEKSESAEKSPADETPYQKAKREGREREATAWQKIEAEKAAVKAEREALEKARSEAPKTDNTPEEWEQAAAIAERQAQEAEGLDPEEQQKHAEFAKNARQVANRLRFDQWRVNFEKAIGETGIEPLKNGESPERKALNEMLLAHKEVFGSSGGGGAVAVKLFVAEHEQKRIAGELSALKTTLEAATKERDELRQRLSIGKSGPVKQGSDDTAGKDPSERELLRMAAELDASTPA